MTLKHSKIQQVYDSCTIGLSDCLRLDLSYLIVPKNIQVITPLISSKSCSSTSPRKSEKNTWKQSRKAELSTPRYKSIPRFQRQSVQNREMLCFLSRWQTFLTHICTKNTAYTVCTLRIVDLFVSADSSAVCVPTPTPSLSFPHWTRCAWPPEKWPTPPLLQCTCDHVCGGATSAVQLIQSIIEMSII